MNPLRNILDHYEIPPFLTVHQNLPTPRLDDVASRVTTQLDAVLGRTILPGQRIGVAVGSRGIANLPTIVACVVDWLHARGASACIIPAMGSHGGATATGQQQMLADLQITQESVGAPIVSSMEVTDLGDRTTGPCWYSTDALATDGIIVVNRVKAHTDICGTVESGIRKMITIGLGKHTGALYAHRNGLALTGEQVAKVSQVLLARGNVVAGVAILENAADQTRDVVVIPRDRIIEQEARLLAESRGHLPRILIPDIDVLVVDWMGKDMSGDGMDPNVIGRSVVGVKNPDMHINQVVVLDLTEASHGNATGIGLADVTTKALFDKIDYEPMYVNGLTAQAAKGGHVPLHMPDHRTAIQCAQHLSLVTDPLACRMVRIPDTLHLAQIQVSVTLRSQVEAHPDMTIVGGPHRLEFDAAGNLF